VNRETSDISSLYRQFGGDPRHYREIGRSNRAGVARERWPLLSQVQPGTRYVPPKVGSSTADRPVVAASWPPLAVPATLELSLPDHASVDPVRAGAVASAEAVAALIHSAQVERQALDALTVPLVIEEDATASEDPVGDIEFAPAVPAATPAIDPPVAEAYVATVPEVPPAPLPRMQERVEPHLQPRPQPIQAAANDAAPVAAKPAATTPTTSLQGIFDRLARAPRSDANPEQDSPPRKTTQK